MDNNSMIRVESTLNQIKADLLLNENIRKLLVLDNMAGSAPTVETVKDFIFLQPVVDTDTDGIFNKSVYISITTAEDSLDNENINEMDHIISISIMVEKHKYLYTNGTDTFIRVYHLAQEVLNTINGKKYSCTNPVEFNSMVETITNKNVTGFTMLFYTTDGISEIDDKK